MEEDGRDPQRMAAALRALPAQPEPSRVVVPGLLDGLDAVVARLRRLVPEEEEAPCRAMS